KELAQLMDVVETEGVSLAGLKDLVPEEFASHWSATIEFLKIVVDIWPVVLKGEGKLSAVERRNLLLKAEAERLRTLPPSGPVIVAGVSGSIPATVDVLKAVAALPNGTIVLPGFDRSLTAQSLKLIREAHPEHPQFGLAKLIEALGVVPGEIEELPGDVPDAALGARRSLMSEAMRPASETERWHDFVAHSDAAAMAAGVSNLALIEAPTAQDEAEVVALILREAIETPGQTAALVSPDRNLARRVTARLETMGLQVDDSAGRPLAKTPPGAFLNLVIDAWAEDFEPRALMALLKHPLLRLGLPVAVVRRAARALEVAAFRTLYLGRGLDGITLALDQAKTEVGEKRRRQRAVVRLWEPDWAAAHDVVTRLRVAYQPLLALARDTEASLVVWADAHAAAGDALARTGEVVAGAEPGQVAEISKLWHEEAGEDARQFFDDVQAASAMAPQLAAADYPEFYCGLTSGINVRPRVPVHPRLAIWGPFEARLQQPDVVILGSLNDGTWPEAADPGAWLNRPMRKELGLPSPEEKIGYAAHDFTSLLGAKQVYLTRSEKIDGVPMVPSRWLLRIEALLNGIGRAEGISARTLLKARQPWLAWARARDMAPTPPKAKPPAPVPPLEMRPRQLPVTAIERWLANPYAIYAQHVLRLEKLPELGEGPGAALKGQIIHEALGRFAERYPTALPDDIAGELIRDARVVMQSYAAHPRVMAFWLPRFERFAHWFAETEAGRRGVGGRVVPEVSGALLFNAPGGAFTLRGRADRIDISGPQRLTITDYKTGRIPTDKRVTSGASPQLPLEAAIAFAGGFANVPQLPVERLVYIKASGAAEPGDEHAVKTDDVAALARETQAAVEKLVADFDNVATPYRATRRAAFKDAYDFDDFAHLARVEEWSGGDTDGGEE
ncbi:MAG: double-strand break repair protein AddB, partial [Hyphomicrobiaceae bacterium]